MEKIKNYIGGRFAEASNGQWLDNINPATGEVIAYIPDSGEEDIENAVSAGREAFPEWSSRSAEERAAIMRTLADLIEQDLTRFARAETDDSGKPVWLSESIDIPRAARNFRFFASAIEQFSSEAHFTGNIALNYTDRSPLGVVGCISPWNLPLYLFTWKVAPALAAGNCVVAKPSEMTPVTAYMLSALCEKAGFPPGVFNIVHGEGGKAGKAIVAHPSVKAITFTGGTQTGKDIASVAGPMFKKMSLEMGGKNPTILFEDCDLDNAIKTSIRAAFTNQGEICLCGSRILVHESIFEHVEIGFLNAVNNWITGDPLDRGVNSGALISKDHFKKVMDYIELAKEEGGSILAGGNQIKPEGRCKDGYFLQPTVITGLPQACRTNREEIFGPVATLIPFRTEEEALRIANDTEYGLSASVWTSDLQRAHRVAAQIEAGIVWVNCWMIRDLRTPFGGMKNSGVGREGGNEALRFFTEAKNICISY